MKHNYQEYEKTFSLKSFHLLTPKIPKLKQIFPNCVSSASIIIIIDIKFHSKGFGDNFLTHNIHS